jgi:Domain of unknown function (DUF4190)/zinc-ribbon domain
MSYCTDCGAGLPTGDRFCSSCGSRQAIATVERSLPPTASHQPTVSPQTALTSTPVRVPAPPPTSGMPAPVATPRMPAPVIAATDRRSHPVAVATGILLVMLVAGLALDNVLFYRGFAYYHLIVAHVLVWDTAAGVVEAVVIVGAFGFGFMAGWLSWPRRRNLPAAVGLAVVVVVFIGANWSTGVLAFPMGSERFSLLVGPDGALFSLLLPVLGFVTSWLFQGNPLPGARTAGPPTAIYANRPLLPGAVPSAGPAPYRTPGAPQASATNGLAIASLILGIVCLGGLGSILAIIFGYIGKRQIDESRGAQSGRGMAVAGIVLGWIGTVLAVVFVVVVIVLIHRANSYEYNNGY